METTSAKKHWPRAAKSGGKKACTIANCSRPYRAKGYCFFHYKKWRQGELPHSRYRVCSNPECRTKAARRGLCEKHLGEKLGAAGPAVAAAAPAKAPEAPSGSGAAPAPAA